MLRDDIFNRTESDGDCLLWTGPLNNRGYGRIYYKGKRLMVHRVVSEAPIGVIVDHLCHNKDAGCPGGPTCRHRRCVNPEHLEVIVSQSENRLRATRTRMLPTSCKRGHPWPENMKDRGYQRVCTACERLRNEKRRRREGIKKRDSSQCKRGHEFTEANTYVRPDGWRECKTCRDWRWSTR